MSRYASSVIFGLALALAGLSGSTVQARSAGETLAASGYAGMTCAEFSKMSPRHREALTRQMAAAAPADSLSSLKVLPKDVPPDNRGDAGSVAGTPLDQGMIVSACQAAPPSSTIGDAYSRANSSRRSGD